MTYRPETDRETRMLSEPVATRLLSRASELDAALKGGASVAELRRAAVEAGISSAAFEAALVELHESESRVPVANTPAPPTRRKLFAVVAALFIVMAAFFTTRISPRAAPAGLTEQAFLLRCLTSGQAAELIQPLLRGSDGSVVFSPDRAPGVITVRATPSQMQEVRILVDRYEGGGPQSCNAVR